MSTFPVTTSTLSARELGVFVCEQYGLSESNACELFRTGINHTYFISNGRTKFVFRVYCHQWRSKSEITEEINLLNLLKNNDIGISFPIPDKNGDFIQNLNAPEGTRYAVLFSFAEGSKVRCMGSETCFSLGRLMAKIHTIIANKKIERIQYNGESLLNRPYQYAKRYFSESLEEMAFLKTTCNNIQRSFENYNKMPMPTGIVHMDFWYDNMNVTDTGEVTLFDFDFCGNGLLLLDIAYFYKQLFHIETDKTTYKVKIRSFLDGYQSIRALSEKELKLIPDAGAAVWSFYLGVQARRFDWSNIFLTENYLKMYVGKLRSWMDYYQKKEITSTAIFQ